MTNGHRPVPAPGSAGASPMVAAWERFVGGDDHVRGVRPEVATSWHRCREKYRVDPHLTRAPPVVAEVDHAVEHHMIFAELGGHAVAAAREVENLSGIATVTDAGGCVLASWGDHAALTRATDSNLSPGFCWSERAAGTNGMGTALEEHGPVLVNGAEHWCEAFHHWVCAGVAVRDVVTREPIAVLNVSCWRTPLPGSVGGWLAHVVSRTQGRLKRRARESGGELVAAFARSKGHSGGALAAVDAAGKVVIADEPASVLMGVPAATPAVDPTLRWSPGMPDLVDAARYAGKRAAHDPGWTGSAQVRTHGGTEPMQVGIRPVFLCGYPVGSLVTFGAAEGERPVPDGPPRPRAPAPRLIAVRDNRMVLLKHSEVRFAESDGNDVWLVSDRGRLRAATQGLDKLDAELTGAGFLRVHRRYVVNLDRVTEIERGCKGELFLIMGDLATDVVPVSRRNAPGVRRELGV